MQPANWSDLRYLLAIMRGRTLTSAAGQLRVDDTTVSRRLAALQAALQTQLVQRQADNKMSLTAAGQIVARRAEAMEQQVRAIAAVIGTDQAPCVGTVRVTSVPILANRLLAGAAAASLHGHPGRPLGLIPDSRDLSLTRREADLALRVARPTSGGASVKARRIGTLGFAAYAAGAIKDAQIKRLPWIGYDESMSHLPQARWMARVAGGKEGNLCGLRVHDAETALEAAAVGLGKTLLPTIVADGDPRLRRLPSLVGPAAPSREIWLLAHADQIGLARVTATIGWLENVVKAADEGASARGGSGKALRPRVRADRS